MDKNDLRIFTKAVPIFHELSLREIDTVCDVMIHRTFSAHEIIVREDDYECQTFFIIASGKVDVAVLTADGKKTILATMKTGDFFGEMSILDGEPRSASVIASANCEIYMLYRQSFLEILRIYPQIAIQMLIAMSKRLRKSNRHINTLSKIGVYGRVAEVILQLAKDNGNRLDHGQIIILNPPTHQIIADMAGTSRETVSRILSQLRKKRYITSDRKRLVILNEEKLYD